MDPIEKATQRPFSTSRRFPDAEKPSDTLMEMSIERARGTNPPQKWIKTWLALKRGTIRVERLETGAARKKLESVSRACVVGDVGAGERRTRTRPGVDGGHQKLVK